MLKPGCTTALFAVVVSLTIPAAAQSPNPAGMSSAAMPAAMPSVAPIYIESADFSSVLNLVNELRVPLQATVDVYSLDGVKAASETITMAPYSSRQLSMESIFASAVPLQLGSIRVTADHTGGLLAALSLTHRGSPATYFDEELAMPSMEGSSVARGVADDARGGTPITAITSLSSSPQNITLSCVPESGAAQQRTLEFGPNQTLLMRPCAGDLPAAVLSPSDIENAGSGAPASGSRTAAAIAVTSDAMPGEFAVYGIVPHGSKDNPFFTSINFSDPKTRRSSGSTYVGVPVGPSTLLTDGSYSPGDLDREFRTDCGDDYAGIRLDGKRRAAADNSGDNCSGRGRIENRSVEQYASFAGPHERPADPHGRRPWGRIVQAGLSRRIAASGRGNAGQGRAGSV